MKAEDYEVVKVIGRGAFGEVQLVRTASFNFYSVLEIVISNFFCEITSLCNFPFAG